MKLLTGTILLFSLAAGAVAQTVSVKSMLPQMVDLGWLAKKPKPYFKTEQASSYDRKSTQPGTADWFANGDWGKYLRTEDVSGRKEHVLADLQGPGAVVRIWSANPGGTMRFYFDGEATPRMSFSTLELLTGKTPEFRDPFSYESSRGTNLYFPLPYAKSLKITVDNTGGYKPESMYYQVGYRAYAPRTNVETFKLSDLTTNRRLISDVAKKMTTQSNESKSAKRGEANMEARSTHNLPVLNGPAALTHLQFRLDPPKFIRAPEWEDPAAIQNLLRTTRLIVKFDGELSVDVPLGDFFSTTAGINPYDTLPMSVSQDGTMICRYVMPFRRRAEISLRNDSDVQFQVSYVVGSNPFSFDNDTFLFRSQWTADRGHTRPFRDMTFLNATGDGQFIGSNMHIANPVGAWWGEGDEKVFVDGEGFPSTFGTGTEDYYGYAWCSNQPFVRAYHAQPRCDGPGNRGHTSINRWHILDPLTFTKSLKFDMEMWHWAEVEATFARTAYWYSKPGGSGPVAVNTSLLLPPFVGKPKPVEGAIEGEKLVVVSRAGGATEVQSFEGLSSEEQLWWRDAAEGDTLVLRLTVPEEGNYEIQGNFCTASDYGIHQIKVHGQVVAEAMDFYSKDLKWTKMTLGTVKLPKGEVLVEVTSKGHRAEAQPRNMFGLDYLKLVRRGDERR